MNGGRCEGMVYNMVASRKEMTDGRKNDVFRLASGLGFSNRCI